MNLQKKKHYGVLLCGYKEADKKKVENKEIKKITFR